MTQHINNNFGFKKVNSLNDRQQLINDVFSNVANKYDLMNDIMSFGVHRLWKQQFISMIPNLFNSKIIDVASGTGDIAINIINKAKKMNANCNITVSDINSEMLNIAKDKMIDQNIHKYIDDYVIADAEELPFEDNSFDYYTIAFGIRNTKSVDNVLKEAYRVLKPTGKFLCLEFAKIESEMLAKFYDFYSFNIIPKFGKFITKNEDAYRYLVESIKLFPAGEEFRNKMVAQNFIDAQYQNLSFGVAAIYSGYKI